MSKKSFVLGALVATGAVLLIPGVAAAVARAGRPLLRSAMKNGSTAYDDLKKAGAEAYEHFEDVVAEVRSEMKEEASPAPEADDFPEGGHEPEPDKA